MTGPDIIALGDVIPDVARAAFIAPGARIIGNVALGVDSSIWYNCILRADVNHIRVGARTNIQDGTILHCDSPYDGDAGYPTLIGDDCLIGHQALLHGCILHDRAFVGMGAIALNGGVIESDGMLGAGAMLTAGKTIRSGELWVGRPAKYLRDLTREEIAQNFAGVARYVENAQRHAAAIKAG